MRLRNDVTHSGSVAGQGGLHLAFGAGSRADLELTRAISS